MLVKANVDDVIAPVKYRAQLTEIYRPVGDGNSTSVWGGFGFIPPIEIHSQGPSRSAQAMEVPPSGGFVDPAQHCCA